MHRLRKFKTGCCTLSNQVHSIPNKRTERVHFQNVVLFSGGLPTLAIVFQITRVYKRLATLCDILKCTRQKELPKSLRFQQHIPQPHKCQCAILNYGKSCKAHHTAIMYQHCSIAFQSNYPYKFITRLYSYF